MYLIIIVLGLIGEGVIRERIVVGGDAAATAANIRSMELVWRLGIASEFVLLICAGILSPSIHRRDVVLLVAADQGSGPREVGRAVPVLH